jgi:hypothetical protein
MRAVRKQTAAKMILPPPRCQDSQLDEDGEEGTDKGEQKLKPPGSAFNWTAAFILVLLREAAPAPAPAKAPA